MRTDIKELIQLISKEHANEEQERRALRELYDEYCIPFYFTALCFFKNEKIEENYITKESDEQLMINEEGNFEITNDNSLSEVVNEEEKNKVQSKLSKMVKISDSWFYLK